MFIDPRPIFAQLSISSDFTSLLLRALVFLVIVYQVTGTFASLKDVPGPFLAKFTNLWRLLVVWRRDSHDTYLRLHKQYGDLLRIGPNCVSISKPDMVSTIYGINKGYVKSDFYAVWQNVIRGKRSPSLVFTTDEQQHAVLRRPVAGAFALSTLVEFEPLIDSTTAVFLTRLDELFASTEKVCDLGTWLQWFAFDVIGELTFSKRLGFLEKAEDVEGITQSVAANFDRCSVLGQMPWLDLFTYKNPIYLRFFVKPVSSPIVSFGQRRLEERLNDNDGKPEVKLEIPDPALRSKVLHGALPSKPDFLSRFLALHEEQPDVVTDRQVLVYLFANINAGSDTIGSTLRAVFYYLLKNRSSLDKLVKELEEAQHTGKISIPLPTWPECQALPYLNAVIKEALRMNPALALPMERIVPASGLQIGDTFLPPGTIVGINPWVLHRDTRIFGADAEEWQPQRWLSDDSRNSNTPRSSSRSKRSNTNLANLRLAPLSTKFADPPETENANKTPHDESPKVTFAQQHSSYIQGKSAPSTPGILSRNSSRRQLGGGLSRRGSLYDDDVQYQYGGVRQESFAADRADMGSGRIPKAKSEAALFTQQPRFLGDGLPMRKKQLQRGSKTGTSTPRRKSGLRLHEEDWFARASAATHDIVQEAKGQSWLASRNSSTTLTHLESDGDEDDEGYEEMAALSASNVRSGGPSAALSPSASRVKSPMWGSRYGSRSASRRTSRRGSFTGTRTPLAAPGILDMTSYFTGDPLGVPIEPDFVIAEADDGEGRNEEGEVARLSDQHSYGLGGIVDRLMHFNLFSVAERDEIVTDEEDRRTGTENERDQRRAAGAKQKRNEGRVVVPPAPSGGGEQGEGGWQDAAWLLSVASKAIF
ncbi:hypothetical protein B0A54_01236 [Friedmanniomyces endolithicus]|uniref:Cytochrome P450 n=1 Tax=Friedmanniomyces endolithicus TaxID=329885 RepID=A0A4U0VIT4_9PEZI|nr:hypothetical protein B0A54_01236 [Friedmanniomyces endolithicus]